MSNLDKVTYSRLLPDDDLYQKLIKQRRELIEKKADTEDDIDAKIDLEKNKKKLSAITDEINSLEKKLSELRAEKRKHQSELQRAEKIAENATQATQIAEVNTTMRKVGSILRLIGTGIMAGLHLTATVATSVPVVKSAADGIGSLWETVTNAIDPNRSKFGRGWRTVAAGGALALGVAAIVTAPATGLILAGVSIGIGFYKDNFLPLREANQNYRKIAAELAACQPGPSQRRTELTTRLEAAREARSAARWRMFNTVVSIVAVVVAIAFPPAAPACIAVLCVQAVNNVNNKFGLWNKFKNWLTGGRATTPTTAVTSTDSKEQPTTGLTAKVEKTNSATAQVFHHLLVDPNQQDVSSVTPPSSPHPSTASTEPARSRSSSMSSQFSDISLDPDDLSTATRSRSPSKK
jgi:hypothetical protein